MMKPSILVLAAMLTVPAFAQMAAPAVPATPAMSAAPPASYPPCKAGQLDSCDQSTTSEKFAASAAQAEASGGVGDRNRDQAARMGSGKMSSGKVRHHRNMTNLRDRLQNKVGADDPRVR